MKYLLLITLVCSSASFARDPGTASNTTIGVGGNATPDAGPGDTSVMGGGTPGNEGINTRSIDELTQEDIKKAQKQAKRDKQDKDRGATDQ